MATEKRCSETRVLLLEAIKPCMHDAFPPRQFFPSVRLFASTQHRFPPSRLQLLPARPTSIEQSLECYAAPCMYLRLAMRQDIHQGGHKHGTLDNACVRCAGTRTYALRVPAPPPAPPPAPAPSLGFGRKRAHVPVRACDRAWTRAGGWVDDIHIRECTPVHMCTYQR